MTRFFVTPDRIEGGRIHFDARDSHHIAVVLKMRAGEQVTALDDTGTAHVAVLDAVGKSRCEARIVQTARPATEPSIPITVAQAIPKTLDKLEWVLQHGVEAGVSRFVLFESTRARSDAARLARKIERWREIVKTAAEQSGRVRLPVVTGVLGFGEMLTNTAGCELRLLAYESERGTGLRDVLAGKSPRSVMIVIGPEGGFTDTEVAQARDAGLVSVGLGPRILRTETAALIAVAQIVYALDADAAASGEVS